MLSKIFTLLFCISLLSACSYSKQTDDANNYQEKYRSRIHFSPEKNWMNGPAGLVYLEGEYHLFYPHNPVSLTGRATHWGHAVSDDLIHWRHLPIALEPDSLGSIISGSVVVDKTNTSGFGTTENPPLVALFTYHNYEAESKGEVEIESQGLAYSLDKGVTWSKYDRNPVIANPGIRDFKDSKVIWHNSLQKWIMVLAVNNRISFYTSDNLKEWTFASDFGTDLGGNNDICECPDLFEIEIDDTGETKWILIVNMGFGETGEWGTSYFTGDFDGSSFIADQTTPFWVDYGNDHYAGSTVSNMPDNKRVLIGWMNNWEYAAEIPTKEWKGTLTLPRELKLMRVNTNYLLTSEPVKELESLYADRIVIPGKTLVQDIKREGLYDVTDKIPFPLLPTEVKIRFKTDDMEQMLFAEKFGVILRNKENESLLIGYDNFNRRFYVNRKEAIGTKFSDRFTGVHILPFDIQGSETLDLRIILDKASFELFTMDGKVVMTDTFYPSSEFDRLQIFVENGRITVDDITVTQLKSIW